MLADFSLIHYPQVPTVSNHLPVAIITIRAILKGGLQDNFPKNDMFNNLLRSLLQKDIYLELCVT